MGSESKPGAGAVEPIDFRTALEERYLAYALSTITARALPDVRDGLKPVHRRLLYAMRLLRLDPGAAFKKCARVVGDVIGKYHPHGDQAVYDALVRLAQDFAQRYPLIEGQGNFGNVDGDNPAAMRYTEARLTEVARLILDGLDEDAVDFRETYDGSETEPIVLPGAFPNLLANGSAGIAVGMATSIPPHNAAEICDAALYVLEHPEAKAADIVGRDKLVKGPDFPTGGILLDDDAALVQAYETGRGSFRTRAKYEVEDLGRGTWQVVVTQIPYQVQKAKLVERLAEYLETKKLPLVEDVRDESAEDIRLAIMPRSRTVDAALMMESVFRLTELETRFPLNMNVLAHGRVPGVRGLVEVLKQWLDHRREVLVRRSKHRLAAIEARLEVLGGYLVAFLNLDEVIRIIRESEEPKPALMARFELTENQAEAILNMRLRALRKLEEIEIRKEHAALTAEKGTIEGLLASEKKQWKTVAWEIKDVCAKFSPEKNPLGKRRTVLGDAPTMESAEVAEALVEREPVTVVVSEKGWIRALKGHLADSSGLTFKAEDKLKFILHAETTDKLILLATNGKAFTLGADKLPGGRGAGEPVRLMVEMEEGADLAALFVHRPGSKRLLASREGYGFIVEEEALVATTRKGRQVQSLGEGDVLKAAVPAAGDHVAVVGENRKLLIFPAVQIPDMARGKGVRLQRFKDGGLADIAVFAGATGLTWTDTSGRAFTRSLDELRDWVGDRAAAGRLAPPGFPRSNRFAP